MKIAILGNLAGVANEIVVGLRKIGVKADLFISADEVADTFDDLAGQTMLDPAWIQYIDPLNQAGITKQSIDSSRRTFLQRHFPITTIRKLLRYDLIHAHSGSLNFSLLSHLLFVRLRVKKYLAFATGSDIREVALFEKGTYGYLMRAFFKNASQVLLLNSDMLTLKNPLGLTEASFFPFVINEEKFSPGLRGEKPEIYKGKLLCFMMSRLDFGMSDCHEHRSSMKCNERFLYALAEFCKVDLDIHAIVLDRGSDRDFARQLVKDLGISDQVTFHPPMTELERIKYLRMADVVIDQFNLGSFGLCALEALSVGKPLITHLCEDSAQEAYGDIPPILNARTASEILEQLLHIRSAGLRENLSFQAREWILKHHSREVVVNKLMNLYKVVLPH